MSDYADTPDDLAPAKEPTPTMPAAFETVAHKTAIDIDAVLTQDELSEDLLKTRLDLHREVTMDHLHSIRGRATIDIAKWRWPEFLFIPGAARAAEYWLTSAPDDHRYALDWISPPTSANHASRVDGTTYTFGNLNPNEPGKSETTSAGVGVYYKPSMSLGLIELQPQVDCSGTVRTFSSSSRGWRRATSR